MSDRHYLDEFEFFGPPPSDFQRKILKAVAKRQAEGKKVIVLRNQRFYRGFSTYEATQSLLRSVPGCQPVSLFGNRKRENPQRQEA